MNKLKQYNYILFLGFFFLQQNICSACNVTFSVDKISPSCAGDTDGKITITVIDGTAPFVYSFDGGTTFSTEKFIEDLPTGNYNIVVEDADGCDDSRVVYLSEPSLLIVDLGENISVEMGEEVELTAQIVGIHEIISWSSTDFNNPLGNITHSELLYTPFTSHTIYVYVERDNCIEADSIFVKVEKTSDDVFIPNVFSPNGDGNNDRFNIYAGKSVAKINTFQVLDNWGNIIFEKVNFHPSDPYHGLDGLINGKKMNPNIFVYCAEIEYLDGSTKTFCGDVLMMQ